MKIEMGESLFYSWLRHVKDCQIVQTNWKPSNNWDFKNYEITESIFFQLDSFFENNYKYKIFKKNSSLSQIIQQAECDALGICIQNTNLTYYSVDVAFHEYGLNYGTKDETVCKVIAKLVRTAFCLYGYFDAQNAEIIFASPKINNSILSELLPCINEINSFFKSQNFDYKFRLICNEDFNSGILQPILLTSKNIADTNELFVRSYQMFTMFTGNPTQQILQQNTSQNAKSENININNCSNDYKELKIGRIAQTILRNILENGSVSEDEIKLLQTAKYSKQNFDIQLPLLVSSDSDFEKIRYYSKPLNINGKTYYMCSQWFEVPTNNDRPYLIDWINKHQ